MVLAALDQARTSGSSSALWLVIAGAVVAYLATISWGLGLPRYGIAAGMLGAMVTGAWLVVASRSDAGGLWAIGTLSRGALGLLLGHPDSHAARPLLFDRAGDDDRAIETIPQPDRDRTRCALPPRGCRPLGREGWVVRLRFGRACDRRDLFAMRWGLGFVGAAVSVYLARRTVEIRSTQSATGIIYITSIFVLFGELTSIVGAGPDAIG